MSAVLLMALSVVSVCAAAVKMESADRERSNSHISTGVTNEDISHDCKKAIPHLSALSL